jgi:hypothetical protein
MYLMKSSLPPAFSSPPPHAPMTIIIITPQAMINQTMITTSATLEYMKAYPPAVYNLPYFAAHWNYHQNNQYFSY